MSPPSRLSSRNLKLTEPRKPARESLPELKKRREASLWRQIIIISAALLLIPTIFLLVVFPQFIEVSGQINGQKYTPENLAVRPQMPMFDAPPVFTNQAELRVKGYATTDNQVQFVFNGKEDEAHRFVVGLNGEFSLVFNLKEGENTLKAYSQDGAGEKSLETKTYVITLDQSVPEFELLEPKESELVGRDKQNTIIKGKTEPQARVLVNTQQGIANDEGEFAINYTLSQGENKLMIEIKDQAGNQGNWEVTLNYRP